MTDPLGLDPHAVDGPLTGRVRVDERSRKLATRLEPGEIAVIDHTDLDRSTAQALVAARPLAVLNAAPSSTGRYPNLGPKILLEAGIVLVDDLGPDVMTLKEGQEVTVDGALVRRRGKTVATGRRATMAEVEAAMSDATEGLSSQVAAFATTTAEYLEREAALLLGGAGLPDLSTRLRGKVALVVMDDVDSPAQLAALKRWVRDADPVVIGVDSGADLAAKARLRPRIIVGDMDLVSEKLIRSGAELVVRQGHDATAPGKDRLDRMGIDHRMIEVSGTSADAAIVMAALSGASAVVTVGDHATLSDFLDRGRAGMSASFFSRLTAGDVIVPASAIARTHKPRIGVLSILSLFLAAAVALGAALWSTPWGRDLLLSWTDRAQVASVTSHGAVGAAWAESGPEPLVFQE